jgi:hypothetical protein
MNTARKEIESTPDAGAVGIESNAWFGDMGDGMKAPENSDTPKTDKAEEDALNQLGHTCFVEASFARELERGNARLRAENDRLSELVEEMAARLILFLPNVKEHAPSLAGAHTETGGEG